MEIVSERPSQDIKKKTYAHRQVSLALTLFLSSILLLVLFIYDFTVISALVDSRNFSCVYFSYFASSFIDRYIIHSFLLRKLNIVKLDVLNHYFGRA